MKRVISLLIVLLLCAGMTTAAFAAEVEFVPSISYKDGPAVVSAYLNGTDVTDCIAVTSIMAAEDQTTDIPQEDRDLLVSVYKQMVDGAMTLPLDGDYVVRELVDVSYICEHDHSGEVTVTFSLGVAKDVAVKVLTYNDGWSSITSVTNNGDGTVTCVFPHFCPVAFCVPTSSQPTTTSPKTGDTVMPWIILMSVSLVALVGVVALRRKQSR